MVSPLFFFFFLDIVSDLFPKLIEKPVDYGILEAGIRRSIKQMGLEDVDGKFTFPFISTFNNRYFLYLNIKSQYKSKVSL